MGLNLSDAIPFESGMEGRFVSTDAAEHYASLQKQGTSVAAQPPADHPGFLPISQRLDFATGQPAGTPPWR